MAGWFPYTNPRGIQIPTYTRNQPAQTPSLADINESSGPAAAGGELFTRMAKALVERDVQNQVAAKVEDATAAGALAGDSAAREMTVPGFQDDATLAGRAFNTAQVRAWQARLSLGLDGTADKILTEHPDDPDKVAAKWRAAVDGLQSQLPPRLAAEVGVAMDARGDKLVMAAQGNLRRKAEGEANADLINGFAAATTKSANAWRDGETSAGQGHDQDARNYLFARTDLSPQAKAVQWQAYQQDRRRDAVLGEYDRSKEAGGLGGATRFLTSFMDGDHPDLAPDFKAKLGNEMAADLRGLEAERRTQVQDLRAEAGDAIFRLSRGYAAPQLPALLGRAKALGDGDTARQLAEMSRTADDLTALARMPLPDQQARVAELVAGANAGTDKAGVARAEAARSVLANTMSELAKDPLVHVAATGQRPLGGLSWDKPETMAARVDDAKTVWQYNRLPGAPQVLTKAEAADLSARLDGANAEQKSRLLGTLSEGFGDHLPSVLDAVSLSQPDFAHAAAIAAQGDQRVSQDILRGQEIRQAYEKKGSAGGRQFMPPNDAVLAGAFDLHLPQAAIANMKPAEAEGLKSAILSSYAAKSFDQGLTHQAVVNKDLFAAAVKDVTGGLVRWNGRDMVAPVRGMGQDQMDRFMAGLGPSAFATAQDERGNPVPFEMIRDHGQFEMISPGRYLIRMGKEAKSYLAGAGGQPYVADLGFTIRTGGRLR